MNPERPSTDSPDTGGRVDTTDVVLVHEHFVGSAPIIDAPTPPRRFRWRHVGLFFGVIVVLAVPAGLLIPFLPSPVYAGGAAGLLMLFLMLALLRYESRRLIGMMERALPASDERVTAPEILRELHNALTKGTELALLTKTALRHVAQRVHASTGGGMVIRLSSRVESMPPIGAPIDTPFEPIPLHDRSPGFQELTGDRVDARRRTRWIIDAIGFGLGTGRWGFWFNAGLVMLTGLAVIGQLIVLLRQLLQGQVPAFAIWMGFSVAVATGLIFLTVMFTMRWFLVPGGILCVPGPLTRARTELYAQGECTVLYWRDMQQVLIVREDGRFVRRAVSPAEVDGLLRAWLSPLPPPDLERATDFLV